MDINTLISGYRLLKPHEYEAKFDAIKQGYKNFIANSISEETYEEFLAKVPVEVVTHYFGAPALDAYLTENLCLLNRIQPIEDVFFTAIAQNLVMLLTYQGRVIHKAINAEVAYLLGNNAFQELSSAINSGPVQAICSRGPNEVYDARDKIINLFDGNERVIKYFNHILPEDMPTFMEGKNFTIGLVALFDESRIDDFNKVISDNFDCFTKGTFFLIKGRAELASHMVTKIKEASPNAIIETRPYRCISDVGIEDRVLILISNLEAPFEFYQEDEKVVDVKYVNAHWRSTIGDQNYAIEGYAKRFTDKNNIEVVKVKRPIVLKSTAPLPIYTRQTIEDDLRLEHKAAVVKNCGVHYSRDYRHSTYFYASERGEIIEDFVEYAEFLKTPSYLNSVGEGAERSSKLCLNNKIRVKGRYIPLCFAPTVHHFHSHFLLQCFPRVLIAREIAPDAKFIVPHDLRKYQREMLHMVGVTDDKMVPIYPNSSVYCDELIIPQLWPAVFCAYSEQIYSEMIKKAGTEIKNPTRKILISREARQTWRNLVNYNVVKDILVSDFGFEVVSPDKFSLIDEINLFRESKIIAGAEGAGMYNCCFASKNCGVLNMADQDYVMYIIASMAQIRGFELGYIFGESFLAEEDLGNRGGHSDFIIDPQLLRVATKQFIEMTMDNKSEL